MGVGYEDRDYMKPGRPHLRPQMPGFFDGAPVAKWLIIVNIAVYFLEILLFEGGKSTLTKTPFENWGAYRIESGFQIWRLITFQFLHANGMHLFSNLVGLFFFAPHVERWMSSRPFLLFYLLCGVAGAIFYTILFFAPGLLPNDDPGTLLLGASAGIFGILAAFLAIAPDAKVLLLFFIPMKMRTFGLIYFTYEVIVVLFNLHNAGGSAGHLGGALVGFYIMKNAKARDWLVRLTQKKSPRRKKSRTARVIRESPIDVTKDVDRILDKISKSGIQSLTQKEREILDKARKQ